MVLFKTLRHMIENLKKKSERQECSFRESRKKGVFNKMQKAKRAGKKI